MSNRLLAPSELQPTFISILDVYQRKDPVSATQDYSSASFSIQQGEKKEDLRTDKKRDMHLTIFFLYPPELIPFRENLINHQRWQFYLSEMALTILSRDVV